jgi:hypothetical protein
MSKRWFLKLAIGLILIAATVLIHDWQNRAATPKLDQPSGDAAATLARLPVKGRAPKTHYSREQFGNGWATVGTCDVREQILRRDLTDIRLDNDRCTVISGRLLDPYTGQVIPFKRGSTTSSEVQIDHVVALSDAWQKGAQSLSLSERQAFANDPIELLAVDGSANQQKSDGDAATWLPKNKAFRCSYVARQIAVKFKYHLWVTAAERDAMTRVLSSCPKQPLPGF